jgi:hypothetical protein
MEQVGLDYLTLLMQLSNTPPRRPFLLKVALPCFAYPRRRPGQLFGSLDGQEHPGERIGRVDQGGGRGSFCTIQHLHRGVEERDGPSGEPR